MKQEVKPRRVRIGAFWLIALAALLLLPARLLAAGPSWWSSYGVLTGTNPNDYAIANQGEAKNMAVAAVSELDTDLAQFGGAGAQLDALASALLSGTSPQENDYAVLNLGQLKALAQPFYDRLMALGYFGPPILVTGTTPLTTGTYPWAAPGAIANDYAMANIGQVKNLFSFDVTYSSAVNASGIPDWWINLYYPGLIASGTTVNPAGYVAWSGSQVTILGAYQNGWNPLNYYGAQTPALQIVSGSGQLGTSGSFVSYPLVVSVTDTNGNPLAGAPVTFAVTSGSLQASSTAAPTTTLVALANSTGQAQAYYQLPPIESNTSQVTASAGPPAAPAQVIFSEASDSGTGSYRSPFAPSDITGVMNGDGSETITWQNNDNASPIYVYLNNAGTWSVTGTLAAGTTSYTIPGADVGLVQIGNNFSPGGSSGSGGGSGGPGGPGPGPGPGTPGPPGSNPGLNNDNGYPQIPTPTPAYAAVVLDQGGEIFTPHLINAGGTILGYLLDPSWGIDPEFFPQYSSYIWKNGATTYVPIGWATGLNDSNAVSGYTITTDGTDSQPQVWSGGASATTLADATSLNVFGEPALAYDAGTACLDNNGNVYAWDTINCGGTNSESGGDTYTSGIGTALVEWPGSGGAPHLLDTESTDETTIAVGGGFLSDSSTGGTNFDPRAIDPVSEVIIGTVPAGSAYYDGSLQTLSSGTAVAVNSLGEVLAENTNGSFSIKNPSSQAPNFSIANWSPGGAASARWNKLHQIVAGDQLLQPPSPADLASNPEATPTTYTLENLLPAGWSGVNATGINDAGEIIAIANYSGTASSITTGTHGVLLLPVQVIVKKQGDPDPAPTFSSTNGILVQNGTTLDIRLSNIPQAQFPIPQNQIVWYSRQLEQAAPTLGDTNTNDYFTAWTALGSGCTGVECTYTPTTSGIFELKATLSYSGTSQDISYVRQCDATNATDGKGNYPPGLKQGALDYFGVYDAPTQLAIRNSAHSALGSNNYAESVSLTVPTTAPWPFSSFTIGSTPPRNDKCNAFVFVSANAAGATVPLTHTNLLGIHTNPPLAYDWYDSTYAISGWTSLASSAYPQPGFVISRPDARVLPGGPDAGKRWAHVGILDYDGYWIQAGSKTVNKYPSVTDPAYQPVGMRKY
jgi:hypothetical protein